MHVSHRIDLLNKMANMMDEDNQPVCRSLALRETISELTKMENALQAARLLCANLEHGGYGHAALVDNFQRLDNI
jgi:hypothetical protein